MTELLSSRRARLIMVLVVASAAISILAFKAAGSSLSYYLTPAEYLANPALEDTRVRVAGRVVPDTVEEIAGRPVRFDIQGDEGDRISVQFDEGVVPNLFGPYALVVVEGTGRRGLVEASSLIIKHEDEFFADTPPSDSISSHFVPATATPAPY
ncbi:MAG: cytochrome c maturation protein CcmE [Chloroflexi bacterium]|nr:cytochrome c maturation protein CcmE [Chloroflexota bacterium]MDA1240057.1 cytochrome c maturation protein CcmE [Chloroflexota bacterium]MQC25580.1 cytochrome c maturation protein CcmE [Chloroflexota bacterium]MQC48125.1 cytochrome c maturation protein CcmE [Chloroflexota bacterium]